MASRASKGASKEDDESKFYDREEKKRFRDFFSKPPAKRGRPKKKKNSGVGRPKKKATQPSQTMMVHDLTKDGAESVDLVTKEKADLDARLEGFVAREKREQSKQKRTNWDKPANAAMRERIARSWVHKNDLYNKGESFQKFYRRCGISRAVLIRFLSKPKDCDQQSKSRGRPSFLSKDQMRHVCEGL